MVWIKVNYLNKDKNVTGNLDLNIRFGKYTLLKRLTVGGMSEIFLAKHDEENNRFIRHVVIKRILPFYNEDEHFVQMFLNEARLAALLNHENIVRIYDIGRAKGYYFISMEHLSGTTLYSILNECSKNDKQFPLGLAIKAISYACEGLNYAYNKKDFEDKPLTIIHRDISPQNLMITFDGDVKLLDFGIAKAAILGNQTKAGVLKGRLAYMSPEQFEEIEIDHRSDLFALGTVLYEVTTNIHPFIQNTEASTLKKIMDCKFEPPSMHRKGYPVDLEQIVLKALSKNPDDRYQTAAQMRDALEDFLLKGKYDTDKERFSLFMRNLFYDNFMKSNLNAVNSQQSQSLGETQSGMTGSNHEFKEQTNLTDPTIITSIEKNPKPSIIKEVALIVIIVFLGLSVYTIYQKGCIEKKFLLYKMGTLTVNSDPKDAEVYINGQKYNKLTPVHIENLVQGTQYVIKVVKNGFAAEDKTLTLKGSNLVDPLNFKLIPLAGWLEFSSFTEGCSIFIDKNEITSVITSAIQLPPGKHILKVSKVGYLTKEVNFELKAGEKKSLNIDLTAE